MKLDKLRIFNIILGIAYIALIAYYIYQSTIPGNISVNNSDKVAGGVAGVIENITHQRPQETADFKLLIRKLIGHYGYFTLLGFVSTFFYLTLPFKKIITLIANFGVGAFYAYATEFFIQANVEGRVASWEDVKRDCLGFGIGTLIVVDLVLVLLITLNIVNKHDRLSKA